MTRLEGKVAFIAGATVGIGRSAAELFAREGAKVTVAGRRIGEGEAVAEGIRQRGGDAIFVQTDVTDEHSVANAIQTTVEEFGALHILLNNAGGSSTQDGSVVDAALEEFWRVMTLDLFGTFLCCRFAIPELMKAGGGVVINMSSHAGVTGRPGRDAYSSAKGGVIALTRTLAKEYVGHKIRVNAIAPAAVRTERIAKLSEDPAFREKILATQILGLIEPIEIASTALFLASDEACHLTGQIISVHGGLFEA